MMNIFDVKENQFDKIKYAAEELSFEQLDELANYISVLADKKRNAYYGDLIKKITELEDIVFKNNAAEGNAAVKIGSIIKFGNYPQSASGAAEPIKWQVLDIQNDKALLISDKALDCKEYNTSYTNVTWETCTLRKWLNGAFLSNAFSAEEQAQIQSTKVAADKNPEYSTDPGNATTDKVFLLSIKEVEKYFSSDEDRKCIPTEYAIAQGAWTSDDETKGGKVTCWWWLRSPGDLQRHAAHVLDYGVVNYYGDCVNDDDGCVRPALWINLDS